MFVAHASRTMANAKPKFRQPEPVIDLAAERQRREHLAYEARIRALDEATAAVRAQAEAERIKALERAKLILAEIRGENARYRHTVRDIERRAAKLFKVSRHDIRSNSRSRNIIPARQFVMYWATRLTALSSPQVGRLMGGRDHTTVLHGREAYREKRAKMGRNLRAA